MKKQIIICALALWMQGASGQKKTITPLTAEFDKILAEQFKSDQPGASVLVARNGSIIYNEAFGMANLEQKLSLKRESQFKIGSLTKQFTAVALLQLVEKGKLKLEDEITKFLPDYPIQGAKITIENLLTHTSGIQNYTAMKDNAAREHLDFTPAEMIGYFKNQPMKFPPGTNFSYSNSNYFLLGYIIEKISGKTYGQYLKDNFFNPLGMRNSSYADDKKSSAEKAFGYTQGTSGIEKAPLISMSQPYAAGAIQSTVEDLYKWHTALFSHKLISKESLNRALTPFKLANGQETAYGYGHRFGKVYDSPSVWHGGLISGFKAMEIYLPKEDIYAVILSNCDCSTPETATAKLAALAAGKTISHSEIQLDKNVLELYPGVYENAKGQQKILSIAANTLWVQSGRGPKSALKAEKEDHFYLNEWQGFEFRSNSDGKIESLVTKNLNGNEIWSRTENAIPDENGIQVDEKILETYAGQYEISPDFVFTVSKEQNKLYLQAPGQEKLEMTAATESQFFLKVNDAQINFVKDASGNVIKAVLNQGGRQADAKKIK